MGGDWEGGQNAGFPWRRVGLALLVGAVVAAGVVVARQDRGLSIDTDNQTVAPPTEDVDVVVSAPLQAGDRWYCPNDNAVRAFDNGFYYPPGYPATVQDLGKPTACYADGVRAEEAGLQLASPPPGSVVAGGVYLSPALSPTVEACRRVARQVGFDAPCPTVLPAPANASTCPLRNCLFEGGVILEQRGFPVPPAWCTDCEPHVVITAVRGREPVALVSCDGKRVPKRLLAEAGGTFVECHSDLPSWIPGLGGYPHARHTMTVWRRGGVTYAASIEGFGEAQQDVLAHIADGIEYAAAP